MYSKATVVETGKDGNKIETEKVFGTGNLTNDPPALREVPGGKKVLSGVKGHSFSIAFNQGKNKEAIFHRLEAWEKTAELLHQFGFKGQEVEVVGRLITESYKDSDGKDRVSEKLVVEKFDVKKYKDNANTNTEAATTQEQPAYTSPTGDPFAVGSGPIELSDDDLPF